MILLRRLSIPRKIVAIAMIISASALLLAGSALIVYDFLATRTDLRTNTAMLGRIVADDTSAAVAFNDARAAAESLNVLREEESIVAACVYTDNRLFAAYGKGVDGAC